MGLLPLCRPRLESKPGAIYEGSSVSSANSNSASVMVKPATRPSTLISHCRSSGLTITASMAHSLRALLKIFLPGRVTTTSNGKQPTSIMLVSMQASLTTRSVSLPITIIKKPMTCYSSSPFPAAMGSHKNS